MSAYSNPSSYWETRLHEYFDLTGVGHAGLGPIYNRRLYAARLQALEQALQVSGCRLKAQHVIEIGCGTGFYTAFFRQQQVAAYSGVDITAVSVQTLAQRFPEYRFVQADIGAPAFPLNEQYDVAFVADVLFHIVDDDRFRQAIVNLAGCLRPGGRLILSDVLSLHTVQSAAHFRSRSFVAYQEVLSQFQLTIHSVAPIFAVMHPPASMPGASILWRLYALIWRYGLMRLARRRWFDRTVPALLDWADKRWLLARAGIHTPNSKWLVATKHVA